MVFTGIGFVPYFDINKNLKGIKHKSLFIMEGTTITDRLNFTGEHNFAKKKPHLRCYKCATVYHYRIRRNWFLKYVLFFLPIKIYFCGHCVKKRYLVITDRQEAKYKPV